MIKIVFTLKSTKLHTASINRFWSIYNMVLKNYPIDIIKIESAHSFFSKYKIFRGSWLRLLIVTNTLSFLRKRNKKHTYVFYLFGVDPLMSLFYYLISRTSGIHLISERNEFPSCVNNGNTLTELFNRALVYPWYFKIFHGYSFITNELCSYYKNFFSKKQQHIILPMTVDFNRFKNTSPYCASKPYLFYAGSLLNSKDGVEYLINSFQQIAYDFANMNLIIAGNSSLKDLEKLKPIIKKEFKDKIIFIKNIPRDVIPSYMKGALVCILPRPDSKQARGGFPTKLGEYLAAARPVIVTRIGEIPNYLTENEIHYISTENIEYELTQALISILNNYKSAQKNAEKGYEKAYKVFSHEANAPAIKSLIKSVVNLD